MAVKQIEKDLGWKKIVENHKNIHEINIKAGLFGNGEKNAETNIAYRGIIQEKGATIPVTAKLKGYFASVFHIRKSNRPIIIPKRPFMANAFDKNEPSIKNFVDDEYRKVIDGKQTLRKMIDRIGVTHEGLIKKSFTEFQYTNNSYITQVLKRSSTPLVNTGEMRNHVQYKVEST